MEDVGIAKSPARDLTDQQQWVDLANSRADVERRLCGIEQQFTAVN
jgi:hypothetical protein